MESGSLGWLGVEVFFVISGFVIPYSIAVTYQKYTLRCFFNYFVRRIIRIELPVTINALMCIVLWYASAATPGFRGVPPHVTAAQFFANISYVAPLIGESWVNPVYWTLAYEFVFYISVGSLFVFLFSKKWDVLWYAAVVVLNIVAYQQHGDGLVLLFVIGMGLCRYAIGLDRLIVTTSVIAVCLFTIALSRGLDARGLEISLTALLTAVVIGRFQDVKAKRSGWNVFIWLGTISYSLYLVHLPLGGRFLSIVKRFVSSSSYSEQLLLSLATLAASIAFAAIYYKAIERPAQTLSKKMKWKAIAAQRPVVRVSEPPPLGQFEEPRANLAQSEFSGTLP
jgi:peptidoglycan/LPS O-acetylase OafA/YrhL